MHFTNIENNNVSFFLTPVTIHEVLGIIKKLKNKMSAGYDEISSNLIKKCAEELAEPLSHIINNSFKHGVFPEALKLAIVKPIFKKGDPAVCDNYRPISLIPSSSKIFEVAMCTRLLSFFHTQKLISHSQHGYLRGRSVETAVYDFVEKITMAMEDKNLSIGIFLDLSKAFDSLDHMILLEKLSRYGVRGPALQWIKSYLLDRRQKVSLDVDGTAHFSGETTLHVGIPQGSVMGPVLFVFYVNDLAASLKNDNSHLVSFADDTNLLTLGATLNDLLNISNDRINKAQDWFTKNRLIVNKEKTHFVSFRPKQKNNYVPEKVQLGSQSITLDVNTKFLGLNIDQHLDWCFHVDRVCNKINSACYSLRVMSKYLNLSGRKLVYFANVHSALRFGVIFWGSSVNSRRVFIGQKRSVRTMLNLQPRDSCRGTFRELNILTLPGIYIYECLVFLFKNRARFAQFEIKHQFNTRALTFNVPKHRLTTTEKSPLYSCIKYFNKLPDPLKVEKKIKLFKKSIHRILVDTEPYTVNEYLECQF